MHSRTAFVLAVAVCWASLPATVNADGQAKTAVCTACHGADGNSSNPIWPNLAGQHAAYIVAQLQAFKSGARENPSMAPMATSVKDEDMAEIGAWYAAQSLKVAALDDEDVSTAEKLYRAGDAERGIPACMACHGPDGAGNGPANYPALRGQHPEYTVLQLQAYAAGTRDTDPQGMMRDIAGRLSEDEMGQLARYLSALH